MVPCAPMSDVVPNPIKAQLGQDPIENAFKGSFQTRE
jgi:hypothetical protein